MSTSRVAKSTLRSAVNLSTEEALAAAVVSDSRKKKSSLGKKGGVEDVDVEGLEDMIKQIEGEEGVDTTATTKPKKPKSKKRLREEATAASAKLQLLSSREKVEVKPEANKFYRYTPVGKAYADCLKIMKQRGVIKPDSDDKLLRLFDDAVREITKNSNLTLSIPGLQTPSSRSSCAKKVTAFEGTLVSYNNYRDNWQLEVKDAIIHRDDEILLEIPRGKLFVKADDSRPSVKAHRGGGNPK